MDSSLLIVLTLAILFAVFIRLRVEPRRARLVNWLFIYPGALVLLYYAWFRGKWPEVLIAIGVAGVISTIWWIVYGSYLAPATSDTINVWGQEAKKPSVVAAEAQEEVERLKKEKEALEKELEQLKQNK
jgi:small-conductance mechanosensitive channel